MLFYWSHFEVKKKVLMAKNVAYGGVLIRCKLTDHERLPQTSESILSDREAGPIKRNYNTTAVKFSLFMFINTDFHKSRITVFTSLYRSSNR